MLVRTPQMLKKSGINNVCSEKQSAVRPCDAIGRKEEPALISRARPTLNLPCISPQNSVTCNGEYRRPVIKAQPSFHDVKGADTSNILTNGLIFSTLKHTDPHTVRGRSTQKDGVCNEHIFRNWSFRELKIGKESNDIADLAKSLTRIIPEIK